MKKQRKALALILAFSLMAGAFAPSSYAHAEETSRNIAQGCDTEASSVANNCGPELAVDGNTSGAQWNSADMKNGTAAGQTQTPQWLIVDLVSEESTIEQIKLWYNMKVWPMSYEIQTTDNSDFENAQWTTVVSVDRASSNGMVVNGEDQNIANTQENTDTITTTSTPALQTTTLKRYVRFYVNKVNEQAGGNNVNLREIQIFGTNDNTPIILTGALDTLTVQDLTISDQQYQAPASPVSGADLVIRGSELENVITNDGKISQWNIGERNVSLLLRLTETEDIYNYVEKNLTVTVPDHSANYPSEWFPTVAVQNEKPEVIPTLQEWYGYEGSFQLTEDSKIIIHDQANVDLQKVAENMQADLQEISGITLDIKTGTAPTSAHDIYIESLTDANAYDVGDEGYIMVTNDQGLHIYAPTYTGCLYGTITAEQILWQAEDHVSIPKGITRDYPAYEVRGIKLDIARTPYRYELLRDYAKIMLWYKMNEFGLHINDNDNCNVSGATYETHSGFHRLESKTFPSLTSETKHAGIPSESVNEDYYNNNKDYQGNPTYTQDQWRDLTDYCKERGMYLLTEIDLPGHSLLYNKYADENPDHISWLEGGTVNTNTSLGSKRLELLDLTGDNKDRALQFAKTLWNEYTSGEDPVIQGDIVHIGSDEYWEHTSATATGFVNFNYEIAKLVRQNLGEDTKIRMWGAGTGLFSTAAEVLGMDHSQLSQIYQLDIWYPGYDNAALRTTEGYGVVNCRDSYMYGNPGRQGRDVPNAEYLFYDWEPNNFGGGNTSIGEPNLLGAKSVIWGDQSQEGMTEKDVHQRVLRAISIVSEKTWGGTDEDDTFTEYELRSAQLAEGPGTSIAMEIDSKSSLVLDYDFEHVSEDGKTLYDMSGNGYHGTITNGTITDGWLNFQGNTLVTTPLKTLSYPYTVSFDLKLDAADKAGNTTESSLFSGYDGRIQVAGTKDGSLSADVNYFTRDFDYQVPTDGTTVNITLVGTFQATKLYVNGTLVSNLFQKNVNNDGVTAGAIQSLNSSILLPLEKIGQDFYGDMTNLKVYNKALTPEEINGTSENKVNVAQNTYAGGESYQSGDVQDNGIQRTSIAMKAIDGEAFTATSGTPDHSTSEQSSYWQGDHADSSLTIDLGTTRSVSSIGIQWRTDGRGSSFDIQTSMDGETWTTVKEIRNNTEYFQNINLDAPVTARYVKMQGISGTYKIQEFMVYEETDISALSQVLNDAQKIIQKDQLSFASTDAAAQALYEAAVFAEALTESPVATQEEIDLAKEQLSLALANYQPKKEISFTDVTNTNSFYYTPVYWAANNNVVNGFEDGTFLPNQTITRGEMVSFLYRLSGSPSVTGTHPFTDVKPGKFFEQAVTWAYQNNIVTGVSETSFAPYEPVTRAQVVTLLYRFNNGTKPTQSTDFKDVPTSKYFYDAVSWAASQDITSGTGNGYFEPQTECTRGQAVTFLYRSSNK